MPQTRNMATRTIFKTGGYTYVVSIPRDFITDLRWQKGQKVKVTKKGKALIIRDKK